MLALTLTFPSLRRFEFSSEHIFHSLFPIFFDSRNTFEVIPVFWQLLFAFSFWGFPFFPDCFLAILLYYFFVFFYFIRIIFWVISILVDHFFFHLNFTKFLLIFFLSIFSTSIRLLSSMKVILQNFFGSFFFGCESKVWALVNYASFLSIIASICSTIEVLISSWSVIKLGSWASVFGTIWVLSSHFIRNTPTKYTVVFAHF